MLQSAKPTGKVQAMPFSAEVHYSTGAIKQNRTHTAKAARHEAKRLAGAANVSAIWLVDFVSGERSCLWTAH